MSTNGTGNDTAAAPGVERFQYGERQELLRESARKLLESRFSTERVRVLMEEELAHDPADWAAMAELGWHGLLVPEEHGGVGFEMLDLGVLLEEMGHAVMPGPFLSSQLALLVLLEAASAAQRKRWLPSVVEGSTIPTLALFEKEGGYDLAAGGARAHRLGKSGWVLDGTKSYVADAQNASLLVVSALTDAGPSLFAVSPEAEGVKVVPEKLVDETRRSGIVRLKKVEVGPADRIGPEGAAERAVGRALPRVWAALAAEAVGTARRVFRISVEYAQMRQQFGRPIGSFQGIKHRLVDRMVELENARSLVYGALWAQDHDPGQAEMTARMAKAYLSEIGPEVGDTAVRTHGGIGFTWECDVHLYWKRLRWAQRAYGDGPYHRAWIAEQLARGKSF